MAPFYPSSDQLYQAMQVLFERIRLSATNPVDNLQASKLVIRIRLDNPQAEITVNGRMQPVRVLYGESTLRPDLDVSMAADTLHLILKHEISLKQAIANRQMKVIGPIWRTKPLADILNEGRLLYPQVLKDIA